MDEFMHDLVEDAAAGFEAVVEQFVHLLVVEDVIHHLVDYVLVQGLIFP